MSVHGGLRHAAALTGASDGLEATWLPRIDKKEFGTRGEQETALVCGHGRHAAPDVHARHVRLIHVQVDEAGDIRRVGREECLWRPDRPNGA